MRVKEESRENGGRVEQSWMKSWNGRDNETGAVVFIIHWLMHTYANDWHARVPRQWFIGRLAAIDTIFTIYYLNVAM